jgi:hypothetical protein
MSHSQLDTFYSQSLRKIKEEDESEGHPPTNDVPLDFEMFQHVMKTGVIYATSRARVRGFDPEDPEWVSLLYMSFSSSFPASIISRHR